MARLSLVGIIAAAFAMPRFSVSDDPAGRLNPNQRYMIANPPDGETGERGFEGEFFEVYSPPIRSQYSEVVWHQLPPVPLPKDIVERYDGKVIAFTGHEVDVVRKTPNGDVSVPCYESYNHHYGAAIQGLGATLVQNTPDHTLSHSHGDDITFVDNGKGSGKAPTRQIFSEHNGNEARQSYHGLPSGYVKPMESPTTFVFTPMQINTRNPDGSGRRCRGDCPLPRSSAAPFNATYSGLLECPCTTRVKKTFAGHFTQVDGTCGKATIDSDDECFTAGAALVKSGITIKNSSISESSQPAGCFIDCNSQNSCSIVFNSATSSATCDLPAGSMRHLIGSASSVVDLGLELFNGTATITMSVPDTAQHWYGVGFNASQMSDLPYTIVVDGDGKVSEHRLADHDAGTILQPTPGLTVVSQTSTNGVRTTVLKRPMQGSSPDHYTFTTTTSMQFISAVGSTPNFSQHRARGTAALSLVELNAPTCVCRGSTGTINGFPFNPGCFGEPKSDLLKTHNPTCDITAYKGGLSCCRGGVFLLDADQNIPELQDEVYYKWRFYFKDYQPAVQTNIFHLEWQFGHIEYDVVQAPAGTPPEEAVNVLTTRFTMQDFMTMGNANAGCPDTGDPFCADISNTSKRVSLISGGFHCHSPACLGGELFNADTGELLCRITPVSGISDAAQDEESYIWIPPCQWGNPEDGLRSPPVLSMNANLTSIKRANSTYAHYGVMAIWQARGAFVRE